MFCRNCGKELTGAPESCTSCGAEARAGTSFCPECGAPTTPPAETCTSCGVHLGKAVQVKRWKTRAAGVLAIVSGVLAVSQWVTVAVLEVMALGWVPMGTLAGLGAVVAAAFTIAIATGIVAIVGGVFALKRRRWRMALAGSICAIFSVVFLPILVNVPLAIAAIVLVVLGRGEFE
jgi:hypothetical protein